MTLRLSVQRFAEQMEAKLRENDHKGSCGWQSCSRGYLLRRLATEIRELRAVVKSGKADQVAAEAADVANFCMMLAENEGAPPLAEQAKEHGR